MSPATDTRSPAQTDTIIGAWGFSLGFLGFVLGFEGVAINGLNGYNFVAIATSAIGMTLGAVALTLARRRR
ncbi:hypothetical protein GCM10010191_00040 [Actinomadura vinacea]|uniref:GlsB/YeaQ/YmgE family stress response membrane protein n=1 Tax=Actinomadura vinacea TaxID=115336 RepID=A0ABN3I9W2_9ACTN